MKLIRGYVAVILVTIALLLADPVQRLIISPWVHLRPASRDRVLGAWIRLMGWLVTRPIQVIGGASIPESPRIPCEAGTLILMNHQSLFDIPLVVNALPDGYPCIITRRRYTRWIPLISHMTRLYQYPSVNPAANAREARQMLKNLRRAARETEIPLVIFPEGTRTKDGEIAEFRPTGLGIILKSRPWTVHVMVVDGFWKHAKFRHLLGGLADVEGRLEHVGVFEWSDPKADVEPFVEEIRTRMIERLSEMRGVGVA